MCFKCPAYAIFKPFSDEAFACCLAANESWRDINLRTGISPVIARHRSGLLCGFAKNKKFTYNRKEGEEYIRNHL